MISEKPIDLSLYLVTDRTLTKSRDLIEIVEQAIQGGVTCVQLREKECSTADFITLARNLKECLDHYQVPLIINDRVDIALAVNATGVHIGQTDMPYALARHLLGEDKIIGLSVETFEEAQAANLLSVDYIGISPIFSTPTKINTKIPFELHGTQAVVAQSKHSTVAIGGINPTNLAQVIQTGVNGVALVSAIISASNPKQAAQELKQIIDKHILQ